LLTQNPLTSGCNAYSGGISLAQVDEPANVVLFNEEQDGYQGSSDDGAVIPANDVSKRHITGAVYSFMDGHAKYYFDRTLVYRNGPPAGVPHYQPYLPLPGF